MTTSEKSLNFHRLAQKRAEASIEAIRIFSNLHSPNYEWTPEEVETYFHQMQLALDEGLERFRETKQWRTQRSPEPGLEPEPEVPPEPAPEPEPEAKTVLVPHRRYTITEIIKEANDDREALAEMVAMQRQVIDNLREQQRATAQGLPDSP